MGGARTVILIWRDDFNICTHLCVKKKCGNRRDTKERRKMQAKLTNNRKEQRQRERKREREKRLTETKWGGKKLTTKDSIN